MAIQGRSMEMSPLLSTRVTPPPHTSRSSCFSHILRWDILVLLLYFSFGGAFYSINENMSIIRSLYLSVITFTTVGFGDISPTTTSCKLFTCFFVFVGLAIIASLIAELLDHFIEERVKLQREKMHEKFDREDQICGNPEKKINETCLKICSHRVPSFAIPIVHGLQQSMTIISINVLVGMLFYSFVVDNFSFLDSFYLSCMTITTVGYGDLSPTNNLSRGFTIIYALLGTLMTGNALSKFASAISDYKQAKLEATVFSQPLNYESLTAMDVDKSNIGVSKVEFVLYKLKVIGALDDDIVQRAEAQFHRLDVTNSGYLSTDDIINFEKKINVID